MLDKYLNVTLDYLEGDTDCEGNHRPSVVVGGDPYIVREAEEYAKKKGIKNPAFTMVFRDPASSQKLGGKNFYERLTDFWLNTMFPDVQQEKLPPWVAYEHKNHAGQAELNIRVVQICDGKKFQLYQHKKDVNLRKAYSDLLHNANPLLTYPNSKLRIFDYANNLSKEQKAVYNEASMIVGGKIMEGKIASRRDIEDCLSDAGMRVIRGRKSIVIERDGVKNTRLKGKILEPDFVFDGENTIKANTLTLDKDLSFYNEKYQKELNERKKRLLRECPNFYENTKRSGSLGELRRGSDSQGNSKTVFVLSSESRTVDKGGSAELLSEIPTPNPFRMAFDDSGETETPRESDNDTGELSEKLDLGEREIEGNDSAISFNLKNGIRGVLCSFKLKLRELWAKIRSRRKLKRIGELSVRFLKRFDKVVPLASRNVLSQKMAQFCVENDLEEETFFRSVYDDNIDSAFSNFENFKENFIAGKQKHYER